MEVFHNDTGRAPLHVNKMKTHPECTQPDIQQRGCHPAEARSCSRTGQSLCPKSPAEQLCY